MDVNITIVGAGVIGLAIASKLSSCSTVVKDFLIKDEKEKGFPGFINLLGIESPGLTSSLSIAKYVNFLLNKNY